MDSGGGGMKNKIGELGNRNRRKEGRMLVGGKKRSQ
jgi:hypothetical protein